MIPAPATKSLRSVLDYGYESTAATGRTSRGDSCMYRCFYSECCSPVATTTRKGLFGLWQIIDAVAECHERWCPQAHEDAEALTSGRVFRHVTATLGEPNGDAGDDREESERV